MRHTGNKLTARQYINSDEARDFRAACERANEDSPKPNPPIEPCVRQYRKWLRKAGSAYQHRDK